MLNWYAVKVLYCVRIDGEPMETKLDAHYHGDEFYEEKLMLVQAEDAQKAADWAAERCRRDDNTYVNRYGQLVYYRFYDWLQVDEIRQATLHNGTVASTATYRMPKGTNAEQLIAEKYEPCDNGELFPLHILEGYEHSNAKL